jgi:hypothetical protein
MYAQSAYKINKIFKKGMLPTKYYYGDLIKQNVVGGACRTHKKYKQNFGHEVKGKIPLENRRT